MSPTPQPVFRKLTIQQLSACTELEKSSGLYPWPEHNYRHTLQSGKPILGLWQQQDLLAVCAYQQVVDEGTILNISVAAHHQGKGLGRVLLDEVIKRLAENQSRIVFLEVRASNERAQQLYRKVGFNEINRRMDYYPTGAGNEDAIEMAMEIL